MTSFLKSYRYGVFAVILFVILGRTACARGNPSMSNKTGSSQNLLSKEELIELCHLQKEDYDGKDLDAFIADMELTKENVTSFNIPDLLKYYSKVRSVEEILRAEGTRREARFTEAVREIAFMENRGSSIQSLYADMAQQKLWFAPEGNVLDDLNRYESVDLSAEAAKTALSKLDALGVFEGCNMEEDSSIVDGLYSILVIRYEDESLFKATYCTGKELPEYYSELQQILFSLSESPEK